MGQHRLTLATFIMLVCCSCAPLTELADQNRDMVAADDLPVPKTSSDPYQCGSTDTDSAKQECLGKIVAYSENACKKFIERVIVTQNTVNSTADITSTGISAIATFTTPIFWTHLLSGLNTIVIGTKGDINADIYAQASFVNFYKAYQKGYLTDIVEYNKNIGSLKGPIVLSEQYNEISKIHQSCNLAAIETLINDKVSGAPSTGGGSPGNGVASNADVVDAIVAGAQTIASTAATAISKLAADTNIAAATQATMKVAIQTAQGNAQKFIIDQCTTKANAAATDLMQASRTLIGETDDSMKPREQLLLVQKQAYSAALTGMIKSSITDYTNKTEAAVAALQKVADASKSGPYTPTDTEKAAFSGAFTGAAPAAPLGACTN